MIDNFFYDYANNFALKNYTERKSEGHGGSRRKMKKASVNETFRTNIMLLDGFFLREPLFLRAPPCQMQNKKS